MDKAVQNLKHNKQESYRIFDQVASSYDRLNHLLSFGIDMYWRQQLIKYLAKTPLQGLKVLDLATGTGDLALALAKVPQVAEITGMDLSQEMLKRAKEKVQQQHFLSRINLMLGNAENIPLPDACMDVVTISFGIRNVANVPQSLKEMFRVLRPGGCLLILEFALPQNPLLKSSYLFYFRHILPLVGSIVSGHPHAYRYLNETVEEFPYGKAFMQLIRAAQFDEVSWRPLSGGIAGLYMAQKRGDRGAFH